MKSMPLKYMLFTLALGLALVVGPASAKDVELLNVSYDPTRELYQEYNAAFAKHWKAEGGVAFWWKQSCEVSGSEGDLQAREDRLLVFAVAATGSPALEGSV